MGRVRPYVILLLLTLLLLAQPTFAQDQTKPIVAVVTDPDVYSLSYFGEESGIGQLAAIFRALGADVQRLNLDEPIPENIQVIVMVRPVNALTPEQLSRLWTGIQNGANFLLALDPRVYQDIRGEAEDSSLNRLLLLDYGLSFRDTFLAESWFDQQAIEDFPGSLVQTNAEDVVVHPILEPLLAYNLPVYLWGARSVDVAALWPSAWAYPLIFSDTAHGERSEISHEDVVFEVNIGEDPTGRLFAGGISINVESDSRLVLLGDSEMLQDAYGLSLVEGTTQPNYVGNFVLAQQLAAWILEVPESDWLALPEGFNWVSIDGSASDWDATLPGVDDVVSDVGASADDIERVRAFHNEQALYLLIDTVAVPAGDAEIDLVFTLSDGTNTRFRVSSEGDPVIDGGAANLDLMPDVSVAVADAIEIRLPLSLIENPPVIEQICIDSGDDEGSQDCVEAQIQPTKIMLRDPSPLGSYSGPLGSINTNGPVNLLSKPVENTSVVTIIQKANQMAVVGRSQNGEWIKVWSAGYTGWIPDFQLFLNIDKQDLPIVDN